jgi:hypothetical protein
VRNDVLDCRAQGRGEGLKEAAELDWPLPDVWEGRGVFAPGGQGCGA